LFGKLLQRSVATTAVVGGVLAVSQLAAPGVSTVSPQIRDTACAYQGVAITQTSIKLDKSEAQYGAGNTAHVTVSAPGNPKGHVTFHIAGKTYNVTLSKGHASQALPRTLDAGDHPVSANYAGNCTYKASVSGTKHYTVTKADTADSVHVADIRHGQHPVVHVHVTSTHNQDPHGTVTVSLSHNGKVYKTRSATLSSGSVSLTFGATHSRGTWTAKAHYGGNHNFRASSGSDTFHVS
jgi:hypothetical protein